MLSRRKLAVLCVLCGAGIAGANQITVWQAPSQEAYYVSPEYQSVTILRPGTFKIEALDGSGGLGYIRKIDVQFTGQPGPVIVYVVRDPREVGGDPHQPGAAEVWQIDLSGAHPSTGTVAELRTTTAYGHPTYGGTLLADSVGTIRVGTDAIAGNVINAIDVGGAITQPLEITGSLLADLTCESAQNVSIAWAADVTVQIGRTCASGPYGGTLHFDMSAGTNVSLCGLTGSGRVESAGGLASLSVPNAPQGTSISVGGVEVFNVGTVGGSIEVLGEGSSGAIPMSIARRDGSVVAVAAGMFPGRFASYAP